MASITTKRGSDGSPRYVVNYRDPEDRQRRKSFHRKSDAEAFRNTVEADKLRGTYLDVDAGRVTFRDYAAEWLASRTFDRTTYEATELRLRVHVLPVIGHLQLRQIKPSTIQGLLRTLELSDTYRRVILANVSAIFGAAVDDDLIAKNPCKAGSVTRPSVVRRRVVPWPAEQVSAMHEALPARYRLAVTLGSGLGLRQGEIFGLSPADFNFLTGGGRGPAAGAHPRRQPARLRSAKGSQDTDRSTSRERCGRGQRPPGPVPVGAGDAAVADAGERRAGDRAALANHARAWCAQPELLQQQPVAVGPETGERRADPRQRLPRPAALVRLRPARCRRVDPSCLRVPRP